MVDAEGDVFVRNLTATGTVNQANTSISTLTVENAATFGDADTDNLTIRSGVWSLTSAATSTIAMTNGLNFDSNTLVIDPNSNRIGLGTSSPYAKLSVVGPVVAEYFHATSTTLTSTFPYASSTAITVSGTASTTNLIVSTGSILGTVSSGLWNGTAISDTYVDDTITLTNLTQITNRAISDTSGTLTVARGGTGQTSFGQGWLNSDGTTLSASTSPTINYLTATSTTATSTFPYLSVTTNSNLGTVVGGTWQGNGRRRNLRRHRNQLFGLNRYRSNCFGHLERFFHFGHRFWRDGVG